MGRKKPEKRKFNKKFMYLLLLLVFPIYWIYPSNWDSKTKLTIVEAANESVEVSHYDPETTSITMIFIPGNTQVEVADNLGKWPLGSVKELGKQEKREHLLEDTIVKTFGFPVNHITLTYKDKVKLFYFKFGVSGNDKRTINLVDTGMLSKEKIIGGEEGYVPLEIPSNIQGIFASQNVANEGLVVKIKNFSESRELTEKVSNVVRLLGARVSTVDEKIGESDIDCKVTSNNSVTGKYLAQIFGCTEFKENVDAVTIEIGKKFSERF